jgi:hypothetical protein
LSGLFRVFTQHPFDSNGFVSTLNLSLKLQLAAHLSESDLTQVKGIVAEVQLRIRRFSEGFTDEE